MAATNTLQRLTSSYAKHLPLAEECCKFLTASPDPFHAVANCVKRLESAGFKALKNGAAFTGQLHAGGKYYYTVHQSTLVAFTVGKKYHPGEGGFHMIGGHTDSPNLKVKPRSLKPPKNGCIMLGVECYGGGLWHTWFDRYVLLFFSIHVCRTTTAFSIFHCISMDSFIVLLCTTHTNNFVCGICGHLTIVIWELAAKSWCEHRMAKSNPNW